MKICITRSTKTAYSETFIQNQIRGISKRATVLTLHSGRYAEKDEEDNLLSPLPFWIFHKLIKGLVGRNNYFSDYGVKRFLKKNEIDLILSNYGQAAAHYVPVCRELDIPLVAHFHGHDSTRESLLKEYKIKYQELFRNAAGIICVSSEMEKKLLQLGAPKEKLALIPYGVDLDKFRPAPKKENNAAFLAVGRFTPKKAPQKTLLAFREVWKAYPQTRLIMVGKKEGLYRECKKFVEANGMSDAVEFTGVLDPQEIAKKMSAVNVFVQHSIMAKSGDMEGTPLSILEAAASGLPIVSTRHGGILDAVIHNETGFLVNEGDTGEMAKYMLKLIGDPNLATQMGRQGRLHIESNYDLKKQTDKLFEFLSFVFHKHSLRAK